MLERLLREADRLWFFFLAAASSSDELDDDPRRGSSILGVSAWAEAAPPTTTGLLRWASASLYPSLLTTPSFATLASAMVFSIETYQPSRSASSAALKVCLWPWSLKENS